MGSLLDELKSKRQDILLGEIAALLHDIGKCYPDFIESHSIDSNEFKNKKGYFKKHAEDIDKIIMEVYENKEENTGEEETSFELDTFNDKNNTLNDNVENLMEFLGQVFSINNELRSSIHSIIKKHHKGKEVQEALEKLFSACDRLDSADDKGIVRQKQHSRNTVISTPFGYTKEIIELDCLKKRFKELAEKLPKYEKKNVYNDRQEILENVKEVFIHALGETRVPANDISLWDHSYSTATIFKTELSRLALGEGYRSDNLNRRIFGICWNGERFINTGKKAADILSRKEIIKRIKKDIRDKFEVCFPIGNVIYEDINGVYLTFPELKDCNTQKLVQECAKKALDIIKEKSDSEIWPFFTLSAVKRNLTVITDELRYAENLKKSPKMSPVIFIDNGNKERDKIWLEYRYQENKVDASNGDFQDICPVCRIRNRIRKKEQDKDNVSCDKCDKRKEKRLINWLKNRRTTIWIDEIADKNNRYALIKINFGLEKWLDGTMISTIYSQTYEDWFYAEKKKVKNNIIKNYEIISSNFVKKIEKIDKSIENLRKNISKVKDKKDKINIEEKINRKTKEKNEILNLLKQVARYKSSLALIKEFLELINKNDKLSADIFSTYFEEITFKSNEKNNAGDPEPLYIKTSWEQFKRKLDKITSEIIQSTLFTQNPSPARISRIWRETEEFWELILMQISERIYPAPGSIWKRIIFDVDKSTLILKNGKTIDNYRKKPLIIKIEELDPEIVHVLYDTNNEYFITIESLNEYSYRNIRGTVAVKTALKEQSFSYLATEEEPEINILDVDININKKINLENYVPIIELEKSPDSIRLLVPASDSIKILQLATELYNEHFKKIIGKLPLNAGLLVANRKFPLYVLLEAGERMLKSREFKQSEYMEPWWDLSAVQNDRFYKYYPIKRNGEEQYTLDELAPISRGRLFELYPGYFDFDLLSGTYDRYSINYSKDKKSRVGRNYKLLSARPLYFHQISDLVALWEILKNNISRNQLVFLEQMLLDKKKKWANVNEDDKKQVYRNFAIATLKEVFGENWPKVSEETKDLLKRSVDSNLLLDTITLFYHILKDREVN